jgi:hypothetical protein
MKLVAGVLLLALAAASPEARYFRYERPLQNGAQRSGQGCLALDAGVFAHAAPHLADLRLYRDGVETPYAIRVATPLEGAEKSIEPLNAGMRGGYTVFDAELPDAHYSDLQLELTAQNFIATVTVAGSRTESGAAETRLGSYTIFDLTRQKLGRSTVLHLPPSDFRYLHFRIAGPLAPESITGLSVERMPGSQPRYETVAEAAQVMQKGHSTVLEFTVPAHVPVDRIAFAPGATPALFSRNVSISVTPAAPTAAAGPPVTSHGNLFRVHQAQNGRRIDEDRLGVDVVAAQFDAATKWTVAIDNGDDAPLTLASVRAQMLERDLCFDFVSGGNYTLYYGDAALAAPRYDYAALYAPQEDGVRIAAGAEQPNPAYQPRPDARPFTEKHPALLWLALVAVVVLLGAIALRSANRSAQTPSS